MDVKRLEDGKMVCSEICMKIVKLDSIMDKSMIEAMKYLESEIHDKPANLLWEEHKPLSYETELHWDPNRSSKDTVFDSTMKRASIVDDYSYNFHTAHADIEMTETCIHAWEIKLSWKFKSDVKIGVSQKQRFNFKSAFCDHTFGWGISFVGDVTLRHGDDVPIWLFESKG